MGLEEIDCVVRNHVIDPAVGLGSDAIDENRAIHVAAMGDVAGERVEAGRSFCLP